MLSKLVELVGIASITIGAFLILPALGFIVLGFALVFIAEVA